jgi:hypothetical protein
VVVEDAVDAFAGAASERAARECVRLRDSAVDDVDDAVAIPALLARPLIALPPSEEASSLVAEPTESRWSESSEPLARVLAPIPVAPVPPRPPPRAAESSSSTAEARISSSRGEDEVDDEPPFPRRAWPIRARTETWTRPFTGRTKRIAERPSGLRKTASITAREWGAKVRIALELSVEDTSR